MTTVETECNVDGNEISCSCLQSQEYTQIKKYVTSSQVIRTNSMLCM